MVETTADELSQDLGAAALPRAQADAMTMSHAGSASTDDSLVRRIEALERTSARQERVFRRLMDLLSAVADR